MPEIVNYIIVILAFIGALDIIVNVYKFFKNR